jgi:hypothetical protein
LFDKTDSIDLLLRSLQTSTQHLEDARQDHAVKLRLVEQDSKEALGVQAQIHVLQAEINRSLEICTFNKEMNHKTAERLVAESTLKLQSQLDGIKADFSTRVDGQS